MRRLVAILLTALFVLSISGAALAVAQSPVGGLVAVKTKEGQSPVETLVMPLAPQAQEEMKQAVAKLVEGGLKDGETLGETLAAVSMVISGKAEDAANASVNVSADMNGKSVAVVVKLPDGTVKVLLAKVKDGAVQFPWDAAWGKKADILVSEIA